MLFREDQHLTIVALGEFRTHASAVLMNSRFQVGRYARVEHAMRLVRDDVDPASPN
jgi:hypothetical protein